MLKTTDVPPVIPGVKIEANYGNIIIRTNKGWVDGDHIIVSGEEDVIKEWLGPMEGFWKGKGQPMLQEFEIVHISLGEESKNEDGVDK